MKGMKRKFFLKRMWNFVVVMLIPALLLVAVTTYMTFVTQMHRMTQDNERGIEAVRSNISLVLDSVLAQNSYMTGMTRTNMVLNKALKRESLSYTDAIYLRSLVSSLNSMTNAYDYVDSVLIYMDGYDRALTSSGLVNLSADDYSGWYSVYSSMSDTERTCIAPVVVNAGKASERRQLVVCARMMTMEGCVAVTLNISHLQEMIAVLRPSDNQHLYLVDGSGRLLAKAGDAGATEELQNLMGKTLSGAGNTAEQEHEFWIKLDDRDCLLNWQSYQNPDFYIVSTIDRAMILENLGERLMPLLLMAVVALYAIVFLAYVNTKRSFDEINLMLQMFEDAEAGRTIQRPQRKVNDEYDVIMNNILMMFLNNTYLNIQLKEKQYRQQNAELTALQLQINPHFLYNTLQTLDMEARKLNDDGRISAVVGYVSDILKYSLTNPQKSVSLREELDYLKKYVEVQHYRFGDRFIIYYEVDDDVMDAEVFRLMLQPVVENSLLHALRGNERGYMKVRARRIGDKVNLRVIDNGDGIPTTLLTIASSALVAYGFARFNFPFKKQLFAILIATLMLPNSVIIIPRYVLFNKFGWVDSYMPFWVPALLACYPFFIYQLIQFMRGIPRDLDESACIDGCGTFRIFWQILLPLMKPALFSAGLFQFLWTYNDYFNSLIFINSVKKYTISLALRLSVDAESVVVWGRVMAMACVAVLPLVLLFFAAQKYFVEGIATSGLKG